MNTVKIDTSDEINTFTIQVKYIDSMLLVTHNSQSNISDQNTSSVLNTQFKTSDIKQCVSYLYIQIFQFFTESKTFHISNEKHQDIGFSIDITTHNTTIHLTDEHLCSTCQSTGHTREKIFNQMEKIHPKCDTSPAEFIMTKSYLKLDSKIDKINIQYVKYVQAYIKNLLTEARMILKDILNLLAVSHEPNSELKTS